MYIVYRNVVLSISETFLVSYRRRYFKNFIAMTMLASNSRGIMEIVFKMMQQLNKHIPQYFFNSHAQRTL